MHGRVCVCGSGDLKNLNIPSFRGFCSFYVPTHSACFITGCKPSFQLALLLLYSKNKSQFAIHGAQQEAVPSRSQQSQETENKNKCLTVVQSAITMVKALPHPWRKKAKKCIFKNASSETSEHSSAAWMCLWTGRRAMRNPIRAHLTSLCRAYQAPKTDPALPDTSINCDEK